MRDKKKLIKNKKSDKELEQI